MKTWLREIRILPLVIIAAGCLFALKALGLMFDGGYTLAQRLSRGGTTVVTTASVPPTTQIRTETAPLIVAASQPSRTRSWMQEMFNYPDSARSVSQREPASDAALITGSAHAAKPAAPPAAADKSKPEVAQPDTKPADGTEIKLDQGPPVSAAERALLERLQERRKELDARLREIELRETMLKAAEKKLEARMGELKAIEDRLGNNEKRKEEAERERLKGLVTMYETMKPKDAAKIFDRLDMKVLIEIATLINPRRMSEILSAMSPEIAEKLTMELSMRAGAADRAEGANLPKIQGRPSGG